VAVVRESLLADTRPVGVAARVVLLCTALGGCDRVFSLDRPDAAPDAPLPMERWASVAGGRSTCGIRLDHTLWCWGRNDSGQLGRGSLAADLERTEPAQVGTDADWESVAIGVDTACAIKLDHSLWCWGDNDNGELGDGTRITKVQPVPINGRWIAVSVGLDHTCAIDEAEAVSCWGYNGEGRLGTGAPLAMPSLLPAPVTGGGAWKLVAAGEASTCGIRTDGTLWCWGSRDGGRLGLGASAPSQPAPVQVGSDLWTTLALHDDFVCAIRDTGQLRCWGSNQNGQLGDRTVVDRPVPTAVEDDLVTDWTSVAAGLGHTCAIHGDGELLCWGGNAYGQLASDLTKIARPIPTPVEAGATRWVSLGLGTRHTCAIDSEGQLWCAGYAASGALGAGEGSRRTPVEIAGRWERPSAGEDATCAFGRAEQSIGCWGSNENGLLGDGVVLDRRSPGPLLPPTFLSFDLGDHGCGIGLIGVRACWGPNNLGQLGNGTTTGSSTPMSFGPTTAWSKLSPSRSHTCGISMTAMYCWGRNSERQTGQPAAPSPNPDAPVLNQMMVPGTWKDVGTGIVFSCGLRNDSKPYCWGFAGEGQLGNGSATPTGPTPVAVTTTQTFDRIFVGARHACAITVAGSAWCWGWNKFGQLGDGSASNRSTPVQLAGTWLALSLGEEHTCGIRSDRTLACWGRNHFGQLGDGTLFDHIDPTPVNDDTDWEAVTAGLRHTCATKLDGRTLCWGGNQGGAIGDDTAWRAALTLVTR
jgi:alpha-tubulin suppressor-like RCC1 family protein